MASYPDQQHPDNSSYSTVTLPQIFNAVWRGKWVIGGISAVFAIGSIIYSLTLEDIYRAQALLAPNESQTMASSGLSGALAQYGGLAGLAGINIGGGASDKTDLGIEVMRSRQFVTEFIERRDILVELVAAKTWDRSTGKLILDNDIYDAISQEWVRTPNPPRQAKPSAQEAYKIFSDQLSISRDKKTGFITLSFEHVSPTLAKQWVDWLVEDINQSIMSRDVTTAEQAIEYLTEKIQSTALSELQNVFFRLIEEQTKTVMLAKVSPEYLFRTLDPAMVPELKAKPKRSIIVIALTIFGGLLGVLIVAIRNSFSGSAP